MPRSRLRVAAVTIAGFGHPEDEITVALGPMLPGGSGSGPVPVR